MERDAASPDPPGRKADPRASLLVSGLAAALVSACCAGPLVLLMLGLSGAWIGRLTMLEPYRPVFLVVATAALLLAGRRIWRPASACAPTEVCAAPGVRLGYKLAFALVATLLVLGLAFPYVAHVFY